LTSKLSDYCEIELKKAAKFSCFFHKNFVELDPKSFEEIIRPKPVRHIIETEEKYTEKSGC
jgi:hypothetical protein